MMELDRAWQELFWAVFQRSSNPIAVIDDHQRIVAVNDALTRFFGGTRFELLGSSMTEYLPSSSITAERNWREMLRSGDYASSQTVRRHDGSEVDVEYASRRIPVESRTLVVVVVLPSREARFDRAAGSTERTPLTKREREVVALIALGMETPEIAERLHLSEHTVRTHVRNAMDKLGARTRAQLVAIVLSEHELQPDDVPAPEACAGLDK